MSAYCYDIEIYPNFFCVSFINLFTDKAKIKKYCEDDWKGLNTEHAYSQMDIKRFIIDETHNDVNKLIEFVGTVKLLIGYNNKNYDDNMLDLIIIYLQGKSNLHCLEFLNRINRLLIEYRGFNFRKDNMALYNKYKSTYSSIDLMSVLLETISRKSLKQCAINIKWYKIQDLPYHYDTKLDDDMKDEVLPYNVNDVLITHALYWYKHDEISLRVDIQKLYGVQVLNANRSRVADILMSKFYEEQSGKTYFQFFRDRTIRSNIIFNEIINPTITFKDPQLIAFLDKLRSTVYKVGTKFEETLLFRNTGYTFATGGLHSIDRPMILISNDKYVYTDADVSSYYPMTIINEKIAPKHLDKGAFLAVCDMIIKERLAAKHNKEKVKSEALKIVANSGLFGKMGFENGFLYDLQAMYAVTLNGQLRLLQLIEMLEDIGLHVISANTDGIVTKVYHSKQDDYNNVCIAWQRMTGLELEFNRYKRYIRKDVNNYLAINDEGKIKTKGCFVIEPELSKGYNTPIIAICLHKFLLEDIPVDDTLKAHTNIYDFCLSQKTGGQFLTEEHYIEDGEYHIDELSKTNRYYISMGGSSIVKKYKDKDKRISLASKETVTLFNNYINLGSIDRYHIDYRYYKAEVYKILNKLYNIETKSIKGTPSNSGISGRMFDELED